MLTRDGIPYLNSVLNLGGVISADAGNSWLIVACGEGGDVGDACLVSAEQLSDLLASNGVPDAQSAIGTPCYQQVTAIDDAGCQGRR